MFISSEPPDELAALLPGKPMTSVFLPCSPNPTTGFYFFVPTDEIVELPYTPEEAVKLVMSAGHDSAGGLGGGRRAVRRRPPERFSHFSLRSC